MSEELFEEVGEEGTSQETTETPESTGSEALPEKKQVVKSSKPQVGEETPDKIDDKQPTDKERWRWMQMRKANRELKEQTAKALAEIESIKASKQEQPKTEALPQWWINSYGNDEKSQQAYRTYQDNTKAEKDRIKAEVLEEIRNEQQSEVKGSEEAQTYIDTELSDMKEDGLQFETNELMKFIVDFQKDYGAGSLLDGQGNYDLRKALTLMQRFNPPQEDNRTEIKKKVAGNLLKTKVNATESKIPVVSTRSLRRGGWREALGE